MARSMFILVSDDQSQIEQTKSWAYSQGWNLRVYSTSEWHQGMQDPGFRQQLAGDVPALAIGSSPVDEGAKILPFPGPGASAQEDHSHSKRVRTINELESIAIENAIHEFNGNLTEAAKALGIGRATLYRKVKQYNIDPSVARRKRVA